MLPYRTRSQLVDEATRHAVFVGLHAPFTPGLRDRKRLLFGYFVAPVLRAARTQLRATHKYVIHAALDGWRTAATFFKHVVAIVSVRAYEQMFRVRALRIIASVQHEQPGRYRADVALVGKAMRVENIRTPEPHNSIAAGGLALHAAPFPARSLVLHGVRVEVARNTAEFGASCPRFKRLLAKLAGPQHWFTLEYHYA